MDLMDVSILQSSWSIIRRKLTKVLSIKTAPRREVFSPVVDRLCCIFNQSETISSTTKFQFAKDGKPWQRVVFQFR
jgi:hypothetical protein